MEEERTAPRHPIGVVARRTQLKPDLIRAWERRYRAIEPGRSPTRRRFYSDADIERLQLLRRVVRTGHGIGQVARLPNAELEALLAQEPPPYAADAGAAVAARIDAAAELEVGATAQALLERCLTAARALDVVDLERQLEHATVTLSRTALLERLLVPLMHRVGELWKDGTLRPIHEHLVSVVVRSFLGWMRATLDGAPSAPRLVVTTPARQRHELGALAAAVTAAEEGWQVTYLGPDLPPEEIAAAARATAARAVALSITYPPDDPLVADELKRLRRLLGSGTELVVGGRAASSYAPALGEAGARLVGDLSELRRELESLRFPPISEREPQGPESNLPESGS